MPRQMFFWSSLRKAIVTLWVDGRFNLASQHAVTESGGYTADHFAPASPIAPMERNFNHFQIDPRKNEV